MSRKINHDNNLIKSESNINDDDYNMSNDDYDRSRYEQLLWVEKYRPKNINDLMLDDVIKNKLIQNISNLLYLLLAFL